MGCCVGGYYFVVDVFSFPGLASNLIAAMSSSSLVFLSHTQL